MLVRADAPPRSRLDVRVSGGVVRGVHERGILAWRGIPYVAPPVGDLRFRAPRPVIPWTDVRDASRFGNVAPQIYKGQFKGVPSTVPSGEDCLTLNVLTAAVTPRKRLGMPVMVFIHGGGYSVGSSHEFTGQGEEFVRTGRVVYVSFNYRLGALGYLDFSGYSTPERPIESNLGLRDQVAALEWVQRNIRAFGGDPHNVTLIGESAGGNAVITLMTTPSARGLFARGIAQSAPANAAYSRETTAAWAAEFVEELRADTAGDESRARLAPGALLATADVTELTRAALVLQVRTPVKSPGHVLHGPGGGRRIPARASPRRVPARPCAPGAAHHRHQRSGGLRVPGAAGHSPEVARAHPVAVRGGAAEFPRRNAERLSRASVQAGRVGLRR